MRREFQNMVGVQGEEEAGALTSVSVVEYSYSHSESESSIEVLSIYYGRDIL